MGKRFGTMTTCGLRRKAAVIIGDARAAETLSHAGTGTARAVIAATGDDAGGELDRTRRRVRQARLSAAVIRALISPGVALARNVGRKEAIEMLVTGDLIDAQTARERGLVNRDVPADHLDAEIAKLAASIVAKPAIAIAMGKEMSYRQVEAGTEAAYQMAGQTMACNLIDPVAQEGLEAFIAKR